MTAAVSANAATASEPRPLTGTEKVAVLLLALGKNKAEALLRRFDPEELKLLTRSTSDLRPISASDLEVIVQEFADKFATGMNFVGTGQEVEDLLSSVMSDQPPPPEVPPQFEDEPAWSRIVELSDDVLYPYLLKEHPQTLALILSKLEPALAAKIMSNFDGPLRNNVLRRMLSLKRVSDEATSMVEQTLREDLLATVIQVEGPDPRSAIAGILNKLDRAQTDELLLSLAEIRPDDAKALKKMLFVFDDLVNLSLKARTAVFDKIPMDVVVLALNGSTPEFQGYVLSALSGRGRRMVEAELQGNSVRPPRDVAQARQTIVDSVLKMAAQDEIKLDTAEEDPTAG